MTLFHVGYICYALKVYFALVYITDYLKTALLFTNLLVQSEYKIQSANLIKKKYNLAIFYCPLFNIFTFFLYSKESESWRCVKSLHVKVRSRPVLSLVLYPDLIYYTVLCKQNISLYGSVHWSSTRWI